MEEKKGAVTTADGAIGNLKCVRPGGDAKCSQCKAEEPAPGMCYFLLVMLLPHICSRTLSALFSVLMIAISVVPACFL